MSRWAEGATDESCANVLFNEPIKKGLFQHLTCVVSNPQSCVPNVYFRDMIHNEVGSEGTMISTHTHTHTHMYIFTYIRTLRQSVVRGRAQRERGRFKEGEKHSQNIHTKYLSVARRTSTHTHIYHTHTHTHTLSLSLSFPSFSSLSKFLTMNSSTSRHTLSHSISSLPTSSS